MTERQQALLLANRILDRPNGDPDDDLAILSRQLLRIVEGSKTAIESQIKYCSNGMIHTDAVKFLESIKP